MKQNILFGLMIVVILLLIAACSPQVIPEKSAPTEKALPTETANTESTAISTGENTITINNFKFDPQELIVAVGTEVTWMQEDTASHTIVSDGLFESEVLNKGESFSFTFTNPGEYNYNCGIHPSMTGTVIVK